MARGASPSRARVRGGASVNGGHEVRAPVRYAADKRARQRDPYFVLYEDVLAALDDYTHAYPLERYSVCTFENNHKLAESMYVSSPPLSDAAAEPKGGAKLVLPGALVERNVLLLPFESVAEVPSFTRLCDFLRAALHTSVDVSSQRSLTSGEHLFTLHLALPDAPAPRRRGLSPALKLAIALFALFALYVVGTWLVAKVVAAATAFGAGFGAAFSAAAPSAPSVRSNPSMMPPTPAPAPAPR